MTDVTALGAQLGRDTFGVVSASELLAAGADMSVVPRLVRSRRWRRLWRGMYLTAAHPPGPLVFAHAALKHAGLRHVDAAEAPRAVVSGLAGARALGLRWVPPTERVQVLVGPEVHRRSTANVLVRRTSDVDAVATWSWGGVRVAEPARLVVDGARECTSLRDVRGLVLSAVADRHVTPDELVALLDGGAVAGTAWCRRAAGDAVRGAASPPEAELVDDLLGRGLPFTVNPELRLGRRFVVCPDIYLVGTGVGAEMDSKERHGAEDALDDTLLRHGRAHDCGLSLLHVTPKRYRADPSAFRTRLLGEVASRRRHGITEPAGLEVIARGPLLH